MMDRARRTVGRWRRFLSRLRAGVRYKLRGVTLSGILSRLRLLRRLRGKTDRNIWYLYVEVIWAGIFMAAVAFNTTYLLRLGASNAMIGWLSSIPSLLAMIVLVPAARFLETKTHRLPLLSTSLTIGRAAFIGVALSPWISRGHAADVVIVVLILRALPMNFFSAGFAPMLADVVPIRDRALVMSTRSIIHGVTIAVCTFLFGRWLDAAARIPWAAFPVNYQILYIVGTVGGVLSAYYVSRIEGPETPVVGRPRPSLKAPPKLREIRANLKLMIAENRGFVRIMANTFVFNLGAWLVGPLYIIYFVKQLGASDGWVGLNTTLAQVGLIGGYLLWRRVMDRKGTSWTLHLTVPLSVIYAFLVAFFPNLNLILAWGILISLINAGLDLSHGNTLYALCPPERRATYMAVYATIANVGAFVAPMAGVALSEVIDIRWVLIIGGVIRLLGAGMFYWFRIRAPEPGTG